MLPNNEENSNEEEDSAGDNDDEYFVEESIMHIEGEIVELKSLVLNMMATAKTMSSRFEKHLTRAVARGKVAKRRNIHRK